METHTLRTPRQAHEWLKAHGVSQAEFARSHDVSYQTVRDLMRGKNRGDYGEAHRVAVLLGMKPAPTGQHPLATPVADQPPHSKPRRQRRRHAANVAQPNT